MDTFNTIDKKYCVLTDEELMDTDGGIGFVAAGLIVLGVVYGSGVVVGLCGR